MSDNSKTQDAARRRFQSGLLGTKQLINKVLILPLQQSPSPVENSRKNIESYNFLEILPQAVKKCACWTYDCENRFAIKSGVKIEVGYLVKVKPGHVEGGLTKFRSPFKIKEVPDEFVVLENGERWNLGRVSLYEKENGGKKNDDKGCSVFMMMEDGDVLERRIHYSRERVRNCEGAQSSEQSG
ncbi:hypothetical protein NDU88_004865 [Pleurodeles waltl]|uniref:Uncharacterized protein n=1 Tax=Pleurodeles waltl TaxID=8319 RepID=A0AAV7PDT1_PLEWA|nr:hypothetical protein NDU88_004865 [Pleurodeles waltl]